MEKMAGYHDLPVELIEMFFNFVDINDLQAYSVVDKYHRAIGDTIVKRRYAKEYEQLTFDESETIIYFLTRLARNPAIAPHVKSLVLTGSSKERDNRLFLERTPPWARFSGEKWYLFVFLGRIRGIHGIEITVKDMQLCPREFAFCALLLHCPNIIHLAMDSIVKYSLTHKVLKAVGGIKMDMGGLEYGNATKQLALTNLARLDIGSDGFSEGLMMPRQLTMLHVWDEMPENIGTVALGELSATGGPDRTASRIPDHVTLGWNDPSLNFKYLRIHSNIIFLDDRVRSWRWRGIHALILEIEDPRHFGASWNMALQAVLNQTHLRYLRIGTRVMEPEMSGVGQLCRLEDMIWLDLLDIDEAFINPDLGIEGLKYLPRQLRIFKLRHVTTQGIRSIFTNRAVAQLRARLTKLEKIIVSTDDGEALKIMRDVAGYLGVELIAVSEADEWKPAEEL